jgi:putative NIF3 family GTP cyclohydrolase 1 type 2
MTVVRYRATDRATAVAALLAVIEHAREHGGSTTVEPRTAGQVGKVGLVLDGPESEIKVVKEVLDQVEGLVEVDR